MSTSIILVNIVRLHDKYSSSIEGANRNMRVCKRVIEKMMGKGTLRDRKEKRKSVRVCG